MKTRKSCVNGRDTPPAAWQVLALLISPNGGGVPHPVLDGGYPIQSWMGGVPHPVLDRGCPIQSWMGGVPHPVLDRGYPIWRVPQSTPVLIMSPDPCPCQQDGVPLPHLDLGWDAPPSRPGIKYSPSPLPRPWMMYPPVSRMGYPPSVIQTWDGVPLPPIQTWDREPPSPPPPTHIHV